MCDQLYVEMGGKLCGLLLGGSVARGQDDASSDIDLFVAINETWSQRRRPRGEGREVDVFIDGIRRLGEHMSPAGNAVIVRAYAEGCVLYDPEGYITALCRQARMTLRSLPREPSRAEEFRHILQLRDGLRAYLRATRESEGQAAYLLCRLVSYGLGTFCVFGRHWHDSEKHLISDIQSIDPSLGKLIEKLIALEESSLRKGDAAVEFVARIISLRPAAALVTETPRIEDQDAWDRVRVAGRVVRIPKPN